MKGVACRSVNSCCLPHSQVHRSVKISSRLLKDTVLYVAESYGRGLRISSYVKFMNTFFFFFFKKKKKYGEVRSDVDPARDPALLYAPVGKRQHSKIGVLRALPRTLCTRSQKSYSRQDSISFSLRVHNHSMATLSHHVHLVLASE